MLGTINLNKVELVIKKAQHLLTVAFSIYLFFHKKISIPRSFV